MPLKTDSKYELMVKMKQEIRNWSQISCYYLDDDSSKKDIDRYSDKYIQRNKPKFIPGILVLVLIPFTVVVPFLAFKVSENFHTLIKMFFMILKNKLKAKFVI